MLTTQESSLSTPSGVTQVPLLTADQLSVGAILTGPAWTVVRQIDNIAGSMVGMIKFGTPLLPGHVHTAPLDGTASGCACGYKRTNIANILPVQGGPARSYILVPVGDTLPVDQWTVYATRHSDGRGGWLVGRGAWSITSMPIIPLLEPVWTLPQALRDLLEEATPAIERFVERR
jgi:hypothetical protein